MKADLRSKLVLYMTKNKITIYDYDTPEDLIARILLHLIKEV